MFNPIGSIVWTIMRSQKQLRERLVSKIFINRIVIRYFLRVSLTVQNDKEKLE